MATFRSLRELDAFVRALPVPAERREIVADELTEHVMSRVADGESEADALASLGDAALLERLLGPAERRFRPSTTVVIAWATGVGALMWFGSIGVSLLYGHVPTWLAFAVHLSFGAALVSVALPSWARRAAYEARIALGIAGWVAAAIPAMFVELFFPNPPPAADVGALVIGLWIIPVFVLIGCRIDRVDLPDVRRRSRLDVRLF